MTAPSLRNALTLSLVLHLAAFAATAVTLRFSRTIVPRVYTVSLVTEEPAREPVPAPPPPTPVPEPLPPKPAPPVAAKPRTAPVTSVKNAPAADRSYIEDRLSSLKIAREKEDREQSIGRIAEERDRDARIKALAAAKASSSGPSAEGRASADAIRNAYAARIQGYIEGKWVYPDIDIRNLEAVISVRIRADGTIEVIGFKSPSGQRLFDRSALKALSKASPVEPPPAALRDETFEIRFSPKTD